jgi:phosphopantothenoylcysteine decarboxylase/phosphopantothenate--cysteine ligase
MSNYKILFGISGSIAAYKSTYLISKLVQNNFEVKVVATDNALKFIGKATLEGLSGNPVYTDSFQEGEMMSHISLVKWADLTIVCPASGNTINKLAAGIGDNLLTSLFLAHDWTKPYMIAPAMNTNMFEHPATQHSIKKLEEWGVEVLPTAEGYLACGDIGKGKLLEPDQIYQYIDIAVRMKEKPKRKLKVLITAGGTKENIDGIRYLSNLSTGRTASDIANYFSVRKHNITYLHAFDSLIPNSQRELVPFSDFAVLNNIIEKKLSSEDYDIVIHNAAVSDFSVESIEMNGENNLLPLKSKISSESEKAVLHLSRNFKILDRIKSYSKNKNVLVVGFKFTNAENIKDRADSIKKTFINSSCALIVQNDLSDRNEKNIQTNFNIFDAVGLVEQCTTSQTLAESLEKIILERIGDRK